MIEVVQARKRYRRRNILNGASFTIEKGKITCLVGLNGSGKSTALKAIMGLVPLNGGYIHIDGVPLSPASNEKAAFIPDHLIMPSPMKLAEAMQFMQDFYSNTWNPSRADELMRFFKLDYSEKIANLSKGTAAKFNLVLGLAQNTDYILMDEPFSGIDLFSREMIAEVFMSDLIEDRGVLITTHEIGEMEHLIDKAILLKDGVIHKEFEAEQMRQDENKSIVDVMREVYRG